MCIPLWAAVHDPMSCDDTCVWFIHFVCLRWRPSAEWSATLPLHDCGWYEVSLWWFTADWCYKRWEGWIQQSFHGYGLATFLLRSSLFGNVTQHRLVVSYGHCRMTYHSQSVGDLSTILLCVMCQKNEDLVNTVAEGWKHAVCFVVIIWENRCFIAMLQLTLCHASFFNTRRTYKY
jgi:hypothetical protein